MHRRSTINVYVLMAAIIIIVGLSGIAYFVLDSSTGFSTTTSTPGTLTNAALLDEAEALLSDGKYEEASALLADAPPDPSTLGRWRCIQQQIVGYSGKTWLASPNEFITACEGAAVSVKIFDTPPVQVSAASAQLHQLFEQVTADPERALPSLIEYNVSTLSRDRLVESLITDITAARATENQAYLHAQVGQTFARHGNWPLAVESFEAALAVEPDYVEAMAYLGLAKDRSGSDGLTELLAASEASADAALPHLFLGMHWRSKNELEKALDSLETAFALDQADPMIAAELGSVYFARGEYEAAEEAYRQSTELAPSEPGFWLLLAQFSLETEIEVDSLALPASRNALALEPEDPATYDALGYSHFLLGNTIIAKRLFLRALEVDASFGMAYYHLGLLYLSEGDNELAKQYLEQTVAVDPGSLAAARAARALERFSD